jgi:hypothetical protein
MDPLVSAAATAMTATPYGRGRVFQAGRDQHIGEK